MSRHMISFVVIAYNIESFIERCLNSFERQTCDEFELVVVNDGSSDETGEIAHSFDGRIANIRYIDKETNEGAHLARKDGCALTSGDYVVFVDGDDEIAPTFVEVLLKLAERRQFDMLRFGRNCIAEGSEEAVDVFRDETHFNSASKLLRAGGIGTSIYGRGHGNDTWSIIDVLFDGDFARRVFQAMTDEALGRTQDAYEMFVLADKAETYLSIQEFRGLIYHLGSGVSGHGMRDVESFLNGQVGMKSVLDAILDYAESQGEICRRLAADYRSRVIETVASEWTGRLTLEQQAGCFNDLISIWGHDTTLQILLGPLTGRTLYLLQLEESAIFYEDAYWATWNKLLSKCDLENFVPELSAPALEEYRVAESNLKQMHETAMREMASNEREHEGLYAHRISVRLGRLMKKLARITNNGRYRA